MAYTEIKERNESKYYYRVLSIRKGKKVSKKREYLGVNLSDKEVKIKESEADKNLNSTSYKDKQIKKLISKIRLLLIKRKIKKAGLFGSYARGEQTSKSDIDLVVEPPEGIGFGFAGIEIELSKQLGKKVDLVSYNGLSKHFRERILSQEVKII